MAQIETHIPPVDAVTLAFRDFRKVVARFFRQIGDQQADTPLAQDRLFRPAVENHMLWEHGMTRSDVSRMLAHTHR